MIYKRKTHTGKIIAFSLIFAFGVGGYIVSQSSLVNADSTNLDSTSNPITSGDDPSGLISIVDKINAIKLDSSVFADPVFVSLKDDTVDLPIPAVGRSNPFAPLGK